MSYDDYSGGGYYDDGYGGDVGGLSDLGGNAGGYGESAYDGGFGGDLNSYDNFSLNDGGFDNLNTGFGDLALDDGQYQDVSGIGGGGYNDSFGLDSGVGLTGMGDRYAPSDGGLGNDFYDSTPGAFGNYGESGLGLDADSVLNSDYGAGDYAFDDVNGAVFDPGLSSYDAEVYGGAGGQDYFDDGFGLDNIAGGFNDYGSGLDDLGWSSFDSGLNGLRELGNPGTGIGSSSLLADAALLGGGAALEAGAASLYNDRCYRDLPDAGYGSGLGGFDGSALYGDTLFDRDLGVCRVFCRLSTADHNHDDRHTVTALLGTPHTMALMG